VAAVDPTIQTAIVAALTRASNATGVDFHHLVDVARRESSFNPQARAPTSSAAGMFQFIESTWLEMIAKHGDKHGLGVEASRIDLSGPRPRVADPATRKAILDLRFDPEIAARMAGEFTRDNAARLEKRLGREPSAGELYAAHVMGAAGAVRLIAAAQRNAPDASALFPREAGANRWLFFARDGEPRSAQALLDRLTQAAHGPQSPVQQPLAPAQAVARRDEEALRQAAEALLGIGGIELAENSSDSGRSATLWRAADESYRRTGPR
jgi:hypothetical protein